MRLNTGDSLLMCVIGKPIAKCGMYSSLLIIIVSINSISISRRNALKYLLYNNRITHWVRLEASTVGHLVQPSPRKGPTRMVKPNSDMNGPYKYWTHNHGIIGTML